MSKYGFISLSRYVKTRNLFLRQFDKALIDGVKSEKETGERNFRKILDKRDKVATGKWKSTEILKYTTTNQFIHSISIVNPTDTRNIGSPVGTIVTASDLAEWGTARGLPDKVLKRVAKQIKKMGSSPSNYITRRGVRTKIAKLTVYDQVMKDVSLAKKIGKSLTTFFGRNFK